MRTAALLCAALFSVALPMMGVAEPAAAVKDRTVNAGTGHEGSGDRGTDAGAKSSVDTAAKGSAPRDGRDGDGKDGGKTASRAGDQRHDSDGQTPHGSDERGHHGGPATGGPANVNAATGKVGEHIDLIRPDDGYASLHRRAIRKSLIANAAKKPAVPSGTVAGRHPFAPSGGGNVMVRNSIGIVAANGPADHRHQPGFMAHTPIGTSVAATPGPHPGAVHPASPVVHTVVAEAGVNGSNFGHLASGPGVVGGPAKVVTGINGTTIRRHF